MVAVHTAFAAACGDPLTITAAVVLVLFAFAFVLYFLFAAPCTFTEVLNRVVQAVNTSLHAVYSIFNTLRRVDVDVDHIAGFTGDQAGSEDEKKKISHALT